MTHTWATTITTLALVLTAGCQSLPSEGEQAATEAGNAAAAEIPLALIDDRILVPVTIGREATFFILDTAASGHVISPKLRAQFELEPEDIRTQEVQGSTGSTTMEFVKVPSLGVGQENHEDQWAVVADIGEFRDFEGREVTGILGTGVLSQYDLEIDLPSGMLRLHPLGTGRDQAAERQVIPFESFGETNFIQFEATVAGQPVNAVLDSGAKNGILNWQAARFAGATPDTAHLIDPESATGGINGKKIPQYRYTFSDICFGTHCLPERELRISDLTVFRVLGWEGRPAMLVGMEWLETCPIFVSYSTNEIQLCEPR